LNNDIKQKIVWSCNLDASGYSSCARSYIKSLYNNNRCDVFAKVNNVAKNINLSGLSNEDLLFFSSIAVEGKIDGAKIVQHCVPDRLVLGCNPTILYTVVELKPPKRWIGICNRCSRIMTASKFCKEIMIDSGIKEEIINVVPHCHDLSVWNPNIKPLNIKNLKDFNFLFVGDYTPRKGGDILVRNFIKTFRNNKDVSLTIKGYFNSFKKEDQEKLEKRIINEADSTGIPRMEQPSIYFYGEPIQEKYMNRFMASFDCLVSPHHGEGFGLAMSQNMCLGKPTISTGYSGNLEFMNNKNSFLIETDGMEKVPIEMIKINPNYNGREWIKIKEESLISHMKNVYENRDKSIETGKKAFLSMKENFSSEKISNKIIDIIEGC